MSSNCCTSFWISSESRFLMLDFYHIYCSLMNLSTCVQSSLRSLNFASKSTSYLFVEGVIPISLWTLASWSLFYFDLVIFFSILYNYLITSAGSEFSSIILSFIRLFSKVLIPLDKFLSPSWIDSSIDCLFFSIYYWAFFKSFCKIIYFSFTKSMSFVLFVSLSTLPSNFFNWLCMFSIYIFWFSRALFLLIIML